MMQHSVSFATPQREENKNVCEKRSPPSDESTNFQGNVCGKNVKIKAEPREEEDIIKPLSGNPFFTCIMLKSHVHNPYQLAVPRSFYSFLPHVSVPIILSFKNKNWAMNYVVNRTVRCFDGWKRFATENKLRIGDGCVFELMDEHNLRFEIRVLNGQVPDMFGCDGQNSEVPIWLD